MAELDSLTDRMALLPEVQEAVVHSAQPAAAPAAPKGIDVSADDFDDDED